jgi:hypothetical protein
MRAQETINQSQSKIEEIQAKMVAELALMETLAATRLADKDALAFEFNTLYGVTGGYGFTSLDCELAELFAVFKPVPFMTFSADFSHTMPESYFAAWQEKNPTKTVRLGRTGLKFYATIGVHGYSLNYFGELDGKLYDIKLDFMREIINARYSSLSKGRKIPHLKDNPNYRKTKPHLYPKYLGVNGASDCNSAYGSYSIYYDFSTDTIEF